MSNTTTNTKHTPEGTLFIDAGDSIDELMIRVKYDDNENRDLCSFACDETGESKQWAKRMVAAPEMYQQLDESSNRIAYCIDLYHLPEEAVAMLRGEIDQMLSVMGKATT